MLSIARRFSVCRAATPILMDLVRTFIPLLKLEESPVYTIRPSDVLEHIDHVLIRDCLE